MCVVDDYDPPQFYSARMRRCRKPVACSECDHPVERGDAYRFISAKWPGDREITVHRMCSGCGALADAVRAVDCSYLLLTGATRG